jgi:catechol 2,3-dioxygenase-like lactoylglutathione lyase family enzyme
MYRGMVHSQLVAVTYATRNPARLAQFWATLLGRESIEDADGLLVPGADGQLSLRFAADEAPPHSRHRMHLHLTSAGLLDQQRIVATAVELGASHLDLGQRPEEGHIVLSDPGGYEFCVIEPDNGYLAGCGPLGELACDGTRAVGLFWSKVLSWPLVWDRDEETALQSPQGGTKVSWGGEPVSSRQGADRQRFELVATGGDLDAEADRLVRLGAGSLRPTDRGTILLADPDGTEFHLRAL